MRTVHLTEYPWISEVNLFPTDSLAPQEENIMPFFTTLIMGPNIPIYRDYIPIIHDNVLYCTLWNRTNRTFYLGSVNLETLERQFMPLPVIDGRRFSFHFVDRDNLYFRGLLGQDERALLVQPRDGSETWTLSLKDFSDSDIRIL